MINLDNPIAQKHIQKTIHLLSNFHAL